MGCPRTSSWAAPFLGVFEAEPTHKMQSESVRIPPHPRDCPMKWSSFPGRFSVHEEFVRFLLNPPVFYPQPTKPPLAAQMDFFGNPSFILVFFPLPFFKALKIFVILTRLGFFQVNSRFLLVVPIFFFQKHPHLHLPS